MHECFANPERNDGFGADSCPSRDDPCRRALRPIEASKAAGYYVRSTSTPAVGLAQIPVIARGRAEWVNSTQPVWKHLDLI
jgi:hypothetical protein